MGCPTCGNEGNCIETWEEEGKTASTCMIGDPTRDCAFLCKANKNKCCVTEGFIELSKPMKLKWSCTQRK